MRRRWLSGFVVLVFLMALSGVAVAAGGLWKGFPTVNLKVNGVAFQGDPPPIVVEGRTFVPVRGFVEAIGGKVDWDEATGTMVVTTPDVGSLVARAEAAETKASQLQAELDKTKRELQKAQADLKQAQDRIRQLENGTATAPPTGSTPQDRQQLIASLKSKVFRLDVYDLAGKQIGSGSAVAVGPREIVTNYHVIEEAARVVVVGENTTFNVTGMLVGREDLDLAVLRVDKTLTPVTIRSDDPKVGEDVIAIGSPRGLTNTVSTGILSATRDVNGLTVLQITAPISPGSSGGGLFDQNGSLVGITFLTRIDGQNLNFAIPMKVALPVIQAAKSAQVQELPGATRPTPANVVQLLSQKYPTFTVGGQTIRPKYDLVPYEKPPVPNHAGYFLGVGLDLEQFGLWATGMMNGDWETNAAAVESYMIALGELFAKAFPGKVVNVYLYHSDLYKDYPWWFKASEISYSNGKWLVTKGILLVWNPGGKWEAYWP